MHLMKTLPLHAAVVLLQACLLRGTCKTTNGARPSRQLALVRPAAAARSDEHDFMFRACRACEEEHEFKQCSTLNARVLCRAGCMAAAEAVNLGGGAGVGGGSDLLSPHGMDAAWVSEVRRQMQHS